MSQRVQHFFGFWLNMNESLLQITAAFSRRHHTISNLFVHFRRIHWLKNYPKIFLKNRLKKLIHSLSMDLFFFKTNLAFASGEEKCPIWTSGTLMNVAQTAMGAFGLGLRIRVWYKGYTEYDCISDQTWFFWKRSCIMQQQPTHEEQKCTVWNGKKA